MAASTLHSSHFDEPLFDYFFSLAMMEHVCGNAEMKSLALANEIINADYGSTHSH